MPYKSAYSNYSDIAHTVCGFMLTVARQWMTSICACDILIIIAITKNASTEVYIVTTELPFSYTRFS